MNWVRVAQAAAKAKTITFYARKIVLAWKQWKAFKAKPPNQ